ncbi:MAG: hypothetical protein QXJ99_03070 [Thermofilum sp.]
MKKVLVASMASRKALAIALSLKKHGYLVYGLSHTTHPYLFSRYFDRKAVAKCSRSEIAWARLTAKVAEAWKVDLVMPVDFVDVETFSSQRDLFESIGSELAAPPFESVKLAADKKRLPQLLEGIAATPRQVMVQEPGSNVSLDALEPPLVVKGLGDASKPEYFPDTKAARERAAERAPCLVQEYIPGVGRGYYAVALDGRPILEFTHQRIIEYDPGGGASLAARGPVMDPRLFKLGRELIKRLKWSGPLMVETRFTPETGKYHVIELNPKFWGSLDLPVSLGYHFPAVLAVAYTEGFEASRKLAATLTVLSGSFYWVLDGLRYLAKVPKAWNLLLAGSIRERRSDFDASDSARVLAQLAIGLGRLPRERGQWASSVSSDLRKLEWWYRRLAHRCVKVILFDLDGTLVDLPVDWRAVKLTLIRRGLLEPWEGILEALRRLWASDKSAYEEASLIVEEAELEAAKRAVPLVNPRQLTNLTLEVKVVTFQTSRAAQRALENTGFTELHNRVVGRDSEAGPLKESIFLSVERPGLVVEDSLSNAVSAMRAGHLPILVSRDAYARARALRLGIPSISHTELPRLISLIERIYRTNTRCKLRARGIDDTRLLAHSSSQPSRSSSPSQSSSEVQAASHS